MKMQQGIAAFVRLVALALALSSGVPGAFASWDTQTPVGDTGPDAPKAFDSDCGDGGCGCHGMCGYNFLETNASLALYDTPVGYAPPIGPDVFIRVTYVHRESSQPSKFAYSNLGRKWGLNWISYIQDNPEKSGGSTKLFKGGGGAIVYSDYSQQTSSFGPEKRGGAVLSISAFEKPVYVRTFSDGSKEVYSTSDGAIKAPRRIFLTKRIDPQGNAVTVKYDAQMRIIALVDATGRSTGFSYDLPEQSLLITKITDPFGRSAAFKYDENSRLISITDAIGMVSGFHYDGNGTFIDALTTPYGVTRFHAFVSDYVRSIDATDPLGYTQKLTLRIDPASSVASEDKNHPRGIETTTAGLNELNTYYWDKHAYAVAPNSLKSSRITHWGYGNKTTEYGGKSHLGTAPVTILNPLESRIWFNYRGQEDPNSDGEFDSPTKIARILDDGSTQLTSVQYNALGLPLSLTDPVGRTTYYTFGQGRDLQSIQQKISPTSAATIAQFLYNSQHRPTDLAGPSSKAWHYAYNGRGQLTSATDPLGYTTAYQYNSLGYLLSIINPNGKTALSLDYDAASRVKTVVDSEGYTLKLEYDNLDRLTKEVYPDGSSRIYTWRFLDLNKVTDREGRTTVYEHDAVRRLKSVTDPLGNKTSYDYWENNALKSLTDPNGNITTWNVDIQSRVTEKRYASGYRYTYLYGPKSGRLIQITDSQNQATKFSYFADGRLKGISHEGSIVATPDVTFTDDQYFPRLSSMTDGTGTTTYRYVPPGANGALMVAAEQKGFTAGNIAYTYDALDRIGVRTVAGAEELFRYDTLGRVSQHITKLGNFAYSYLGETDQITQRATTNFSTQWTYLTNANDRRLSGIINSGDAPDFGFTSTPEGNFRTITDRNGATTLNKWTNTYDKADRLLKSVSSSASYLYNYDSAGNITNFNGKSFSYNNLNQINAYVYDPNGNLIRGGGYSYSWDAENRLVAVSKSATGTVLARYAYDGFGRRVEIRGAKTGETHYLWCGTELCSARNASDKTLIWYFPEGEGAGAASDLLYAVDQLGSIRAAVGKNGAVLGKSSYAPYGEIVGASGARQTDYRFGGLLHDVNTGLDLSFTRALDSRVGRWISRDLLDEVAGPNLYTFVNNSPFNSTDKLGLFPGEIDDFLISLIDPCVQQRILANPYAKFIGDNPQIADYIAIGSGAILTAGLAVDIAAVRSGIYFGTRFGGHIPKLNDSKYLRIGWSYMRSENRYSFRIGGKWIERIKPANPHINLWPPKDWFR